jgi:hypothetical protein
MQGENRTDLGVSASKQRCGNGRTLHVLEGQPQIVRV